MRWGGIVGMAFDAKGMVGMNDGPVEQPGDETIQVFGREEGGGPAAKMNFTDHGRLVHEGPVHCPFAKEGFQVFLLHLVVGGDLLIAAAINAKGFAKRQVDIKAQAFGPVARGKTGMKFGCPPRNIQIVFPKGNGWITGISGNRPIIFFEERESVCRHWFFIKSS